MNEAETRAEHIDPALKAAGWGRRRGQPNLARIPPHPWCIEGHGHRGKLIIADYVQVYRNTKLAVIEANHSFYCPSLTPSQPRQLRVVVSAAALIRLECEDFETVRKGDDPDDPKSRKYPILGTDAQGASGDKVAVFKMVGRNSRVSLDGNRALPPHGG